MDYSVIHRFIAARKRVTSMEGLDAWRAPELASLTWTLATRSARGALLKPRLKRADGLVLCGRGVRVHHARHMSAGRQLNLGDGCEIVALSTRGVTFGERCTVGRYAVISPTNLFFDRPGEGLRLGDNSNIGAFNVIGCSGFVDIGDRVMMGPHVLLFAADHEFGGVDQPIQEQGMKRSFITIEDDCWIGGGAIVTAGVTIGRGCVVAAGSVVTRDLPPYSIAAGSPARVVKARGPARQASGQTG